MIVLGLTGSIAMGKTETARMFAARGVPVFDSDSAVHSLYAQGGDAVPEVAALAPDAIVDGSVDRRRLAALVQAEPSLLRRIESVVHPLVAAMQREFLESAAAKGADMALLDIPLLFEKNREDDVDVIIVVSAGEQLQRQRALSRAGMTEEKLDFILARQLPDAQKRARADYVIDTSESLAETAREVERVIADVRRKARQ
ncbi:dephospho-CoA kinase [Aestuariivirga sp.]|jgi:dephospho-CoA kinase|uniref:dephospho-CoA kinase n=1 Tax=Aestuariivirga sp. TaxID=2650926 RepID=UPI003783104A